MFAADFIYLAALDRNTFVVEIVELYLDYLHIRVLRENAVEHLRLVVERKSDVTHLALRLQIKSSLISTALLEELEIVSILRVHKKEVEVFDSAGLQLKIYQRSDILLGFEVLVGEFIRQNIFAAVMS